MNKNEMKYILFSKINTSLPQFHVTSENKTQGNLSDCNWTRTHNHLVQQFG